MKFRFRFSDEYVLSLPFQLSEKLVLLFSNGQDKLGPKLIVAHVTL